MAASCKIAWGKSKTRPTVNWGMTAGSMWRTAICARVRPSWAAIATGRLSRTCKISARMTRHRFGQCVSATPTTTPAMPLPSANEMSMSKMMWGSAQARSTSQVTAASTRRPPRAAAHPKTSARNAEASAARKPMPMLVDRPATVRTSMSRPSWSVPKGCAGDGGRFFMDRSVIPLAGWSNAPAIKRATSAPRHAAQTRPEARRVRVRTRRDGTWKTVCAGAFMRPPRPRA